ncbi:MAG: hypothetical protein U0326_39205 [Polyangiales bacterium]
MRNVRSLFVSVVIGTMVSASACAPIDGDEVASSAQELVLPGTYSVCASAPHALECTTTSLRRTRDDGSLFPSIRLDATADPLEPVARTCTVTADCMAAAMPTNSCGGYRYIGINRVSATNFNNAAASCLGRYVTCSPYAPSFVADDERTWTSTKVLARVECCAGRCVTAAPF